MISDADYEQLHAQYEARIERHNDEIEEHKETFRLLKAAEAERDAAHEGLVRAATEVINVSLARDAALARVAELEQTRSERGNMSEYTADAAIVRKPLEDQRREVLRIIDGGRGSLPEDRRRAYLDPVEDPIAALDRLEIAANRAAEAERACEKAIRERRSLEQKEDDWHTAYEHALAERDAALARATEAEREAKKQEGLHRHYEGLADIRLARAEFLEQTLEALRAKQVEHANDPYVVARRTESGVDMTYHDGYASGRLGAAQDIYDALASMR